MGTLVEIRAAADSARAMVKLSIGGMIVSGALLVLTVFLGCGIRSYAQSDIFALASVPYALALLFFAGAFFYGLLRGNAAAEDEEKLALARRRDSSILAVEEDVRFTAGRAFENYGKYAPYVLAAVGALLCALMLFFFYRFWNTGRPAAIMTLGATRLGGDSGSVAVLSAVMMGVSFFAGAFMIGQARTPAYRWLRSPGSWLMVGFAVMLLSLAAALGRSSEKLAGLDAGTAKVLLVIFAVLGAELIGNFIVEFYRPRTYELTRPIFESKLLGIFTEPGGIMRNLADALDYQFGFKVSGTWIYSFVERAIFPVIVVWLLVLWLFTSMHMIAPGEVGVRRQFGRIVSRELLEPGMYFTLPRPFGTIDRFSCTKLHEITVGEQESADAEEEEAEDDGHGHGAKPPKGPKMRYRRLVTWDVAHAHEENYFLVAASSSTRPQANGGNSGNAAAIPTVDMLGMSMPVQYLIRRDGVFDYAYGHENAAELLKNMAFEQATLYLAEFTLDQIMAPGRETIQNELKKRIQQAADREKLGVEIVAVNLLDAHPPTVEGVAQAFHSVRAAEIGAQIARVESEMYAGSVNPEAEVSRILQDAKAYSYAGTKVAEAESARFGSQLAAYDAMPMIFKLKAYLDFLEKDCADLRKFIVAASQGSEVYEFNFETSARLDFLEAGFEELSGEAADTTQAKQQ